MEITQISPDDVLFWRWGVLHLNATLVFTWLLMGLLTVGAWLVTRRLSSDAQPSRWQHGLEVLIVGMQHHMRDISHQDPAPYLPFVGTLFLFIATSNLLSVIPGYLSPTGSLSTTVALAICVFAAVPLYGIMQQGVLGYLKHYVQPSVFMLPFNILGEGSRTLALAVRLFGNAMSSAKLAAILLAIAPLIFPVLMQILGLLTGLIHAYIFTLLAMVYIATGTQAYRARQPGTTSEALDTPRDAIPDE